LIQSLLHRLLKIRKRLRTTCCNLKPYTYILSSRRPLYEECLTAFYECSVVLGMRSFEELCA
ncbi:Hypothetical predicted protein, partial [Prunus dulcis]